MSSDEVPSAGGTGLWGTRRIKTYAAAFTVLVAGTVGIAFAVRRPSVHDFTPAWEEKFVIDKTELLQVDCDKEHPLDGGVVLTYVLENVNDAECPYEDYEDGSCYKSIKHCSSQKVLLPNAEDCDEENDYSAICDGDNVNLTFFEEGGYVGQSCDDYQFLSAYMDDEENDASKLFGGVCSTERKLSDSYTKGCHEDWNGGRCAHNMGIKEDKPWEFEMDWKVKAKKKSSRFHFHFHNTKNVFGAEIHTTEKFRDCGPNPHDSSWNRPMFKVKKGKKYESGNTYYAYGLDLRYSTSKNLWDTPKGEKEGGTFLSHDGKEETDVLMYVNTEDWDGHIHIKDAEPWGDKKQPRKGKNPPGCKLEGLEHGDVTIKPASKHSGKCAMWIKAYKKKETDCKFRNLCECPRKEQPFWCYGNGCDTETPSNNNNFPDSVTKFDCKDARIKVGDGGWELQGWKNGHQHCP